MPFINEKTNDIFAPNKIIKRRFEQYFTFDELAIGSVFTSLDGYTRIKISKQMYFNMHDCKIHHRPKYVEVHFILLHYETWYEL